MTGWWLKVQGVDGLAEKQARLDEARFILSIEDPKVVNVIEATNAIEAKVATLASEQRKAAEPKAHRFELSPE